MEKVIIGTILLIIYIIICIDILFIVAKVINNKLDFEPKSWKETFTDIVIVDIIIILAILITLGGIYLIEYLQ